MCFKVTDWPKEDYGKFYGGDSYIILNTYKDKESDEVPLLWFDTESKFKTRVACVMSISNYNNFDSVEKQNLLC